MATENTGAAGTTESAPAGKTGTTETKTAGAEGAGKTGDQGGAAGAAGKTGATTEGAETKTGDQATGGAAGKEGSEGAGKETGGKAGEQTATSKVPEKYELKVPESGAAFVDDADLKFLETQARAAGWSNEDAQAALEEHLATVQAQSDRWAAETKADTTYGGEKFEETQQLARKVIDRVRPDGHERREKFLRFLGRGGAGNHVEVIGFLADLGRMMGEDSPPHSRTTQAGTRKDAAAKLYDHPTSKAADAG